MAVSAGTLPELLLPSSSIPLFISCLRCSLADELFEAQKVNWELCKCTIRHDDGQSPVVSVAGSKSVITHTVNKHLLLLCDLTALLCISSPRSVLIIWRCPNGPLLHIINDRFRLHSRFDGGHSLMMWVTIHPAALFK